MSKAIRTDMAKPVVPEPFNSLIPGPDYKAETAFFRWRSSSGVWPLEGGGGNELAQDCDLTLQVSQIALQEENKGPPLKPSAAG